MSEKPETVGIPAGGVAYRLRAVRATPPPAIAKADDRRQIFVAALEQFDDYMHAAAAVGVATRPLQLYYALASAGAAIIAARGGAVDFPSSHGLKLKRAGEIFESCVRPSGHGMYQAVAAGVGDAPLTGAVELGALFASLPELADAIDEERWVAAARAGPRVSKDPLPYPGFDLVVSLEPWTSSTDALAQKLASYPTLANAQPTGVGGADRLLTAPGEFGSEHISGVLLHFDDEVPRLDLGSALDRRAPEYAVQGQRWVRPRVGNRLLSPLLTWWALLYALSMFSRYDPVAWTRALAIDESPIAADLEYALERATTAIPRLVLGAIWDVNIVEMRALGPASCEGTL